jgi:hypothetical protein
MDSLKKETISHAPDDDRKRVYEPPGIQWEETIDVKANLASACAKTSTDALCSADPMS